MEKLQFLFFYSHLLVLGRLGIRLDTLEVSFKMTFDEKVVYMFDEELVQQ